MSAVPESRAASPATFENSEWTARMPTKAISVRPSEWEFAVCLDLVVACAAAGCDCALRQVLECTFHSSVCCVAGRVSASTSYS